MSTATVVSESVKRPHEGGLVASSTVLAIGISAFGLRILAFLGQGPAAMDWDGTEFIRAAQNLLAGHGLIGIRGTPDVAHGPLYSLLIAALAAVTRNAEGSALAISLVAGALFPVVVYFVAKQAFDRRTGILAGIVVAIHPMMIWLSLQLVADQLAFTLEFAGVFTLLRWVQTRHRSDLAITGALIGLAYLTRPETAIDLAIAAVVLVALERRAPKRAATLLVTLIVPFFVLAAPCVAFVSQATGQFMLEGKTAVNYAIGVRIQRGMSYIEAADGLGPNLEEAGPELGSGYYARPAADPTPSIADRIRFVIRAVHAHAGEVAGTLLSRHYGTPLFFVFVIVGVVAGLRSRRTVASIVILAGAVGKFAALASVAHFWDRYAAPFAPYMAIFGAAGIVVAANAAVRRWPALGRRPLPTVATLLAFVLAAGIFATTVRELRAEADDPRPLAAAGQ